MLKAWCCVSVSLCLRCSVEIMVKLLFQLEIEAWHRVGVVVFV